jgi:hypothetical protein
METFITIAIFDYIHEIEILKHILDQEGIQYYFENELMSSIVPMYTTALEESDLKFIQTILFLLNQFYKKCGTTTI